MEFRFRSGEEMENPPAFLPSHPSSSGYLAAPTLHADSSAAAGGVDPMHPVSAMAAFHRDLQKEQIRAMVIAENLILEEEVRMELHVERMRAAAAAAAQLGERLMLLPGPPMPPDPAPVMFVFPVASAGEGLWPRLLPPAPLIHLPIRPETIEEVPIMETKAWRPNLCGTKRKAAAAAAADAAAVKEWGCALCEVMASSEEGLEFHLQGKKHRAKAAALLGGAHSPAAGEASLRCDICKLQCNSRTMLGSHLDGKKHKARMKDSKKGSRKQKGSNRKGGGGKGKNKPERKIKLNRN